MYLRRMAVPAKSIQGVVVNGAQVLCVLLRRFSGVLRCFFVIFRSGNDCSIRLVKREREKSHKTAEKKIRASQCKHQELTLSH